MGQVNSKKEGVAIAGSTSLATTGAGITLMVLGGPAGMVAGGIILGAGISGTVATTQQALNDKEKFDYKRWGLQTGLGAAGGVIAAPISIAGGAVAAGAGTHFALHTTTRIGIQIGADVTAGMAAGAGTKVIVNVVEGKDLSDGVLSQALISGITGGVASGATRGLNPMMGHVSSTMGKVALQTTSGALVSGTTGALGAVLHNIVNIKAINEEQFIQYMKSCGACSDTANQIWLDLQDKGYIMNNEFTQQCENGISLKKDLVAFEDTVYEIYLLSNDVWKDVWETATHSAALGGVITGVTSTARVMHNREAKQVNKTMSNIRKKDLKQISYNLKEHNQHSCNLEDFEGDEDMDSQWEVIDDDQSFFKINAVHQATKHVLDPHNRDEFMNDLLNHNLNFQTEETKDTIMNTNDSKDKTDNLNTLVFSGDNLLVHQAHLEINQTPQPRGDTIYISFDDFMKLRRSACIDQYLRDSSTN